jgi:large subunit ribosomal protein L2
MNIFNLEVTPFSEGKLIKSAGSIATIAGRDEALKAVFVKMPSGELRRFNENCWATI